MAPLKLGGGYFTKWYLSISFIILLCTSLIYSQDSLTVSGNVSDQAGIPLFGATIVEKGTANGVSSDFDGNYSIEVTDSNATLVFNYVGYSEQEIVLNGDSKVNVFLIQSNSTLNEVVVVGYGAVIKKDLTGAVAQLDAAEVSHQSTNSVTDILRSNVAGLSVGFSNSPSGVSNVRIRGNNSITADASPLIVVDGFIFNGNLADIAPSDIDKLDVLKDASSAAVYGSRGANGVILITTKRGETEKPTINITQVWVLHKMLLRKDPIVQMNTMTGELMFLRVVVET